MVTSIAAGTTAQYYLDSSAYYLAESEPSGNWMVDGGLGVQLQGEVRAEAFENLHAGRGADGSPLLAANPGLDAVGGYDMTFSAPKSVSVLWALVGVELRGQIEAAQQYAVRESLDILNQNAAFCRRGRGGQVLESVSLTVAGFQHGEARPAEHSDGDVFADPALHSHAVILNLGRRSDGTVGRLDGRPLFAWKMAAGAVYHRALAQGLRDLGFGIEIAGTNGIFEIAGIDAGLRGYFSARRDEIKSELAEIGLETSQAPALAAAKALTTRAAKSGPRLMNRHEGWRQKAVALGWSDEAVLAGVREAASAAHHATMHLDADDGHTDVLDALTDHASTFEHRQLVAGLASHLTGKATAPGLDLKAEVARLAEAGAVVELAKDIWGNAIYSTPKIIALERGLYQRAVRLDTPRFAGPNSIHVDHGIEATGLNAEQVAAVRVACEGRAIAIIEGGPGVGKTTLLTPVTDAWHQTGWRVIGASPAWKIATQLHAELGIEARSLDSWLARADLNQDFLSDRTLLLVDEAGLITSQQMDRLLTHFERAAEAGKQVALRLVGDRRQLQPIGGPGLRIVADAIGVQRVDAIVRQRQPWVRVAITDFGKGNAASGLAAFDRRGHLHICDGVGDAVGQVARTWDRHRQGSDRALMIAKTNHQVLALNAAARSLLQARGEVDAVSGAVLNAVTASGHAHRLELAQGDSVRFLQRNDALDVINGSVGKVVGFRKSIDDQTRVIVRLGQREITLKPKDISDERGRVHLAHAYATTVYGAQGLTTERAFVLADPHMDRHDIFVATSRARGATDLFVDRKNLDLRAKAARSLDDRTRPVEQIERLAVLASAFGRSGTRASTLDYLPASNANQSSSAADLTGSHQRHRSQKQKLRQSNRELDHGL